MRLLVICAALLVVACSERTAPPLASAEVPDYAQAVSGPDYRGVIFATSPVVVPGFEERGAVDLGPMARRPPGAEFRSATASEVAAFEAAVVEAWDRLLARPDTPPWEPVALDSLGRWRRQYVGYSDTTGAAGLWVNFYPERLHAAPPFGGGGRTSEWALTPVTVEDGGPQFFHAFYSVDRDSVEALFFNGPY